MKFYIFFILTIFTFSASGAPCKGAPGSTHINQNGSPGGFVSKTASVDKTVVIDSTSEVCESARINGSVKIVNGSEVSGTVVIDGSSEIKASKIKGSARVTGRSNVTNSKICQASQINFNVTNSDYYCQTDDEEPKHPGEIGNKSVLGVDSDVDGIRDDVEVWINNNTSNTQNKDMYNVRMAMKQIAKNVQSNMKFRDNREVSTNHGRATVDSFKCLEDLSSGPEYEKFSSELQIEMFASSMDRLNAWAKLQGNLSGQKFSVSDKKQKGATCEFNFK